MKLLALIIFVVLSVIVFGSRHLAEILSFCEKAFECVSGFGVWTFFMFVALYIIGCFLLIPSTILMISTGLVFGVTPGYVYVFVSAMMASVIAFVLAKKYSREKILEKWGTNSYIKTIDQALKNAGWKLVLLTRLSFIFPFTPLNYILGISRIRFIEFLAASAVGMAPGIFFNVYLGQIAGSYAGLQYRPGFPGEKIFFVVTFIATLLAGIYTIYLIRKIRKEAKAESI